MSQQYAKKSLYLRLTFAAWLLWQAAAFAQTDQGRIVGTVRDLNKGVLPGVSVVVKNERTGDERTTITTDQGYYVVTALKPSFYTVRANLNQFAPAEATHVQVFVGRETRLDLVLRPEGISQTITVQSREALTDNSSAQGTFKPTVINELKFGFNEALTRVGGREDQSESGPAGRCYSRVRHRLGRYQCAAAVRGSGL